LWKGVTSPSVKPAGVQPVRPMAEKRAANRGTRVSAHRPHSSTGIPSGPGARLLAEVRMASLTSTSETSGAPAAAARAGVRVVARASKASKTWCMAAADVGRGLDVSA